MQIIYSEGGERRATERESEWISERERERRTCEREGNNCKASCAICQLFYGVFFSFFSFFVRRLLLSILIDRSYALCINYPPYGVWNTRKREKLRFARDTRLPCLYLSLSLFRSLFFFPFSLSLFLYLSLLSDAHAFFFFFYLHGNLWSYRRTRKRRERNSPRGNWKIKNEAFYWKLSSLRMRAACIYEI